MINLHIWEVLDEQAFTLGHECRGRHRDVGVCAVFAEHVELQSARDAASAGFYIDHVAVDIDIDDVTKLVVRVGAVQSFDEFRPDAVFALERPDRGGAVDQIRQRHQHDAGAGLKQFD